MSLDGGRPVGEPEVDVVVEGAGSGAPWILLPGIHGDRSLHGPFVGLCSERFRLVSLAYPRTVAWSLDDYALAVVRALRARGVDRGWLVGESFGSQVAWAMAARAEAGDGIRICGMILAGGFVRYPAPRALEMARRIGVCAGAGGAYSRASRTAFALYPAYAWLRHGGARAGRAAVRAFSEERRAPGDAAAVQARLGLIAGSDPRDIARRFARPVWQLTGLWDPIVPWRPVRRWLERECPGFQGCAVSPTSDHTVLFSSSAWSARRAAEWIGALEMRRADR